ncbi:MAG: glucans biosynthesis glucosyltransferase MdoH [Alphaproteobacteria bacterium]|nr:glucans biosynthesis glucosyltransferase MdoH [Alphaproteobacteria bacterium]
MVRLIRCVVFGGALATTAFALRVMDAAIGNLAPPAWHALLLVLFGLSFGWLAITFFAQLAGFVHLAIGRRQPGLADPPAAMPLVDRTAVVMAICNEDPARVAGNVQAIWESLQATGAGEAFDLFLLSDTRDPDAWIAEERAWAGLVERTGGRGRIFYRRRPDHDGRKAGNIAEFCQRWGGRYESMIVLDADSLMTGEAMVALARLMQANPRAGLIQVPPAIVNRNTLFARMLQFAGRVYGPIAAAGQAAWQHDEGNYWGHNAIVRIEAFTRCCGLPKLPGRAPLGGDILSHDFVEAAFLVRGGWQVWMVPELGGSWEECPPTLLDYAQRDRRWCQGNLQHAKVIGAHGLHPISRMHLANGILSYVASPFWLAFLTGGLAFAVTHLVTEPEYFRGDQTFLPIWPTFDAAAAIGLLSLAAAMLVLPRVFGVILAVADRATRRAGGGALAIAASAGVELVISTLLAPVMMLFQTAFVIQILAGRAVGWGGQRRDDGGVGWGEAVRRHAGHTLIGLIVGATAWTLSAPLFWWLSPLVAGLVLSIPLCLVTARADLGLLAGRLGLFRIPEETDPPMVIARANDLARRLADDPDLAGDGLARILTDPAAAALHGLILEESGIDAATADADTRDALAIARRRLAEGGPLTRAQRLLLLCDPETVAAGGPVSHAA